MSRIRPDVVYRFISARSVNVLIGTGIQKFVWIKSNTAQADRMDAVTQVLGDGDITEKFTIQAGAFSKTAKEKLEAAGCTVVQLPGKVKWTKKAYFKKLRHEASLKAKAKDA